MTCEPIVPVLVGLVCVALWAGSEPADQINPVAVQAMAEDGSAHSSASRSLQHHDIALRHPVK